MSGSGLAIANLALAFVLELAALAAFALVGLLLPAGWLQVAAGIAGAAAFVALWGVWAAPRSRRRLRSGALLAFKAAIFAVAVSILWGIGQPVWAGALGALAAVHLLLIRRLGQY